MSRMKNRTELWVLYVDAQECLKNAKREGRRTDCLRVAVEAIRGALRNVCHEDAEAEGDSTILRQFEEE